MINDFDLLGIFIPNYTTNIVVNTIKERLLNYTKDNDKLEFLNAVLNLHIDKNYNSVDDLIIKRANYSNHPVILAQLDAYYPIKDWIEERRDEIEKAIKKVQSNKEKKKQLEDSQTTFEINEKYSHLLHDMWELMKGDKIYLIHKDTTLENFKIIFTKKTRVEVKKPIVWLGNKKTLLKLFCSLSDKKIITPTALSWDKDNPLDITFINQENMNPYFLWRDTHSKLSNTTLREQDKIDKILLLFQ
jgi:hypothetical protein